MRVNLLGGARAEVPDGGHRGAVEVEEVPLEEVDQVDVVSVVLVEGADEEEQVGSVGVEEGVEEDSAEDELKSMKSVNPMNIGVLMYVIIFPFSELRMSCHLSGLLFVSRGIF